MLLYFWWFYYCHQLMASGYEGTFEHRSEKSTRILFVSKLFCFSFARKCPLCFTRCMLLKLPTGFHFYFFAFMWWTKCWLQCNGHRIMTPSGFELVCCKPYFALLSATGRKRPSKMKTGRRPRPTDAISICFHASITVKLMNKPLLLVVF